MMSLPDPWHGHTEFRGVKVSIHLNALTWGGGASGPFRMFQKARPVQMSVPDGGCKVGPLLVAPQELYAHGNGFISVCVRDEADVATMGAWMGTLPKLFLLEAAITAMAVSHCMGKAVAAVLRTPSASYLVAPQAQVLNDVVSCVRALAEGGVMEISASAVAKTWLSKLDS